MITPSANSNRNPKPNSTKRNVRVCVITWKIAKYDKIQSQVIAEMTVAISKTEKIKQKNTRATTTTTMLTVALSLVFSLHCAQADEQNAILCVRVYSSFYSTFFSQETKYNDNWIGTVQKTHTRIEKEMNNLNKRAWLICVWYSPTTDEN